MKQPYITIRRPPTTRRDPSATPSGIGLQVEQAVMTESEATEREQSDDFIHIVPSLPLTLIGPVGTIVTTTGVTGDGDTAWGVQAVGAEDSPVNGAGVKVAVIDTGIDSDHPAFRGLTIERRNFTTDVDDDTDGHGTHCAGTIFGRDVDGRRIGVATGVTEALVAKVVDVEGRADTASLVMAMVWAAENGADVISMSLGMDFPGYVERLSTEHGVDVRVATSLALRGYLHNVKLFEDLSRVLCSPAVHTGSPLVVAAAGNESRRSAPIPVVLHTAPPAVSEGVLSVGAVGTGLGGLTVATFSNAAPDLVGPGVDIVSASRGGGLASLSGTSMAAPHAAGVAALWLELLRTDGDVTQDDLAFRVKSSCSTAPLDPSASRSDMGKGLIQAPRPGRARP